MKQLGKIDLVPLRNHWPDEARNFTPWLASEEGLSLLDEALQMELEIVDTEIQVGSYRADIVAKDSGSGEKVVIENQLEPTDHDHIGKLITYAAGTGASTVVWVSRFVREEHRRAIEWLNDNSSSDLSFYAIEIELWKIGESLPAPRLTVVAQPSVDVRIIRNNNGGTTGRGNINLDFWTQFVEHIDNSGSEIRRRKLQPQHWYDVSIGKSGVHIALTVRWKKKDIGCMLNILIPESKDLFHNLHAAKPEIESAIGVPLQWKELPDNKASRIISRKKIDPNDTKTWKEAFDWYISQAILFRKVFSPRVLSFNPSPSEEDSLMD